MIEDTRTDSEIAAALEDWAIDSAPKHARVQLEASRRLRAHEEERARLSEIVRAVKVRIAYIGHMKEPLQDDGRPSWKAVIVALDEATRLLTPAHADGEQK